MIHHPARFRAAIGGTGLQSEAASGNLGGTGRSSLEQLRHKYGNK